MVRTGLSLTAAVAVLGACATTAQDNVAPPIGGSDTLFAKLPQEIRDAGELRVAADAHPPYRIVEPSGKITGIDADVWDALSGELGIPVKFESAASLPAILSGLGSGRYDAYNGPLAVSPQREEALDMVTWLQESISYLYETGGNTGVSTIADVCGKRVGHGVGNIVEDMLPKLGDWCVDQGRAAPEAMPLKDTSTTVLALSSHQIDIAAMTESAALDLIRAQEDKYDYVTQGPEQGAQVFLDAVVTPKGSGLAPVLLEAWQRLFTNGGYDEIIQKWGLENERIDAPQLNPMSGQTE
ncbi:transporter substrate-binding domain-containing protein [Nocardia sp. CA-290969]|uniref:transporter substrate-binding domain-containing protein n=1 Tax=Nocardia sp. CA-290969 TaxID=3239986 RepID=UPI003D8ADC35